MPRVFVIGRRLRIPARILWQSSGARDQYHASIMRKKFVSLVEQTVGRSVGINGCGDWPLWAMRECGLEAPAKPPFQSVASPGLVVGCLEQCADRIQQHAAEAGDIVVMLWKGQPRHVGVLVGEGMMVHAWRGVVVKMPVRRGHKVVEWWRLRGL